MGADAAERTRPAWRRCSPHGLFRESGGVGRVGADELAHRDVVVGESPTGALTRAPRLAVPGDGVGQQRDVFHGAGMSLPGLRIPAGSTAAFTARRISTPT